MKIRKNDPVIVIAGKDKGKKGKVLVVDTAKKKVLVEGVNRVKRHVKPGAVSKEGGIITVEKPIDISNVMYFDDKLGKAVRIGYTLVDGKKYRINKRTGDVLETS
ncbi:MAG: 50S ribosomal protein L24, large subunit ribosomal protein L24 [candidate division WWE3 bacterium GW2011_GWC1_41_7]|uniref:Large ribosomal subunit protein uL24 n=4 Tax=Katanobacteria TaxID=422282 RepID=A0A0G1A530_UNCKA|nr:MAG: 50S ribosomal protein L24 [candidate division WWE3 bacterium GW2011_GWB1_41_6]KKS20468.1 MAG: 50S ribosomal protein L24, large subunit ribosomal protein L24 [candidate division WWE3 bacterium GW2011_GWC1_41_7]KKS22267.1 MAG: 50S ribosomal protein L24 [candidate division WWE3 bacterium GW2011_GWA1_41_8]OGC56624.1 MAG: 50S ribosomal protein L24 [candidate division WWE3 bacterium RIFCSPLOWO2_01_FULL_41_9]